MSREHPPGELRMIPIDRIRVLNPRDRNGQVFEEIVDNIKALGLKKPVTVAPRTDATGPYFLLICGEGRLKAFKSLRQLEIPAMVVNVSDEDALIMSLAENISRRQGRPLELLAGIDLLKKQGYDRRQIARKTGLNYEYVAGIFHLLEHGEERLLIAVQRERIPLSAALSIAGAGSSDKDVQAALQEAYESGQLRGSQLLQARKIIEHRRTLGRSMVRTGYRRSTNVTSASLIRTYQQEVERQRLMVRC